MKLRSLLLTTSFLALTTPAFAAPAHVQGCHAGSAAGGSTVTCTLANGTAAGDIVMGAVSADFYSSLSLSSVKTDKGDTLTVVDTKGGVLDGAGAPHMTLSTFEGVVSAGSTQIIATFSGAATYSNMVADEYSGLAALDVHAAADQEAMTTTAVSSGPVTPTVNGELIYSATVNNGMTTAAVGSGFVLRQSSVISGDTASYSEDQVQATAAAIAGTFTASATGDDYMTGVMAFKPLVAGPSIDMSDGSHIAPVSGDFLGVNNGAWAPVAAPSGGGATVSVGTTTTGAPGSNAAVTNSGTSSAAVFNFTIPQGATGQNGANAGQNTYPACPAPNTPVTLSSGNTSMYCSANGHTDIAVAIADNTWVFFGPASSTAP